MDKSTVFEPIYIYLNEIINSIQFNPSYAIELLNQLIMDIESIRSECVDTLVKADNELEDLRLSIEKNCC